MSIASLTSPAKFPGVLGAGAYVKVAAQPVNNSQAAYIQMYSAVGSDHCALLITNQPGIGYLVEAVSTLSLNGETSWAYEPGTPVHLEMSINPAGGAVTFWKDGSPVCVTGNNSSFAAGAAKVHFGNRAAPGDRLLRAAFSGVHIAKAAVKGKTWKIQHKAPRFDTNPQALSKTNGAYRASKIRKNSVVLEQK
jgi:hypothetical protein